MDARQAAIEDVLRDLGLDEGTAMDQQASRQRGPNRAYQHYMQQQQQRASRVRQTGGPQASPSIRMGAQGFPETDYTPDTESNLNYQLEMLLFPELQSEAGVGAHSEHPGAQSKMNNEQLSSRNHHNQKHGDDVTKGITIESILDPHFTAEEHTCYYLTLKIKYQTRIGESLCVVGDIEELGSWKHFIGKMKWTTGHIWVLEDVKITSKPFFTYKYVLMKDERPSTWERGQNRIADLRILHNRSQHGVAPANHFIFREPNQHHAGSSDSKRVELFDIWESFSIKFSIYYPLEDEQFENIHISGSLEQLGRDARSIKMDRASNAYGLSTWLQSKYGQETRPWEYQITFNDSVMKGDKNLPIEFTYKYFLVHDHTGQRTPEKIKIRKIALQPPETYKGVKTRDGQMNTNKLWIVNGVAHKVEGNFTSKAFSCTEIGHHGIYIGDYPQEEDDFQRLLSKGIKTVINVMADDEIADRQIEIGKAAHLCTNNEIKYQRLPLNDFSDDQYSFDLTSAAKELARALNHGKVFLHCSSGVSRSPTLALTYLCLYKKVEDWQDPKSAAKYLQQFCKATSPNTKAIELVFQRLFSKNAAFQSSYQKQLKSSFQKSSDTHTNKQEAVRSGQTSGALDKVQGAAQRSGNKQLLTQNQMQKNYHGQTASEIPPQPRKIQPLNTVRHGSRQGHVGYETSSAITHKSKFKQKPLRSKRSQSQMSAPWDDDGQLSHTSDSPAAEELLRLEKEAELMQQRQQELEVQQQIEKERRAAAAEEAQLEAERQRQQALLELEKRRQSETENMLKNVEAKIRKEMEESLRQQQAEAAKRLAQREEEQKREIEQLRGAVLAEKEEKRKMKEVKRQQRLAEQAKQFEKEAEEKQKLLDEISQRMSEVEQLKKQLQDEAGNREQIELEKMKKQKDLEEILEKQREAAKKEKEEAIKLCEERENEELQKLNVIQEQLKSANEKKRFRRSHKRQNKLELLQRQQRERELEEQHAVFRDEGVFESDSKPTEEIKQQKSEDGSLDHNKEDTDFDMEADKTIGVIDNSTINKEQPKTARRNDKGKAQAAREPVRAEVQKESILAVDQQEYMLDEVETDNIQFASGSERDSESEEREDVEDEDDEALSEKSEAEGPGQSQAKENESEFGCGQASMKETDLEPPKGEAADQELADQQLMVDELAKTAQIVEERRIPPLADAQKEQLEAEVRQKQEDEYIQLLAAEKLRKEKEVEEARQALAEIQAHEAEQCRVQEERDAILVQKAVEAAKLLMEQEIEAKKQQELEAKAQLDKEKLIEIKKRDEIIEQLQAKLKQQQEMQEQEEIQKAEEMKLIKEESARFAAEALKAIERAEREEQARKELEEAERQAKLEVIRQKEEEERMQREAQEALEKAQRLQAELEEAERQAQHQALMEAAVARVAGEMIIDRVEAEIIALYYEEVHGSKTQELEALQQAEEEAERQRIAEIEELHRAEEEKYQELLRLREEEQERFNRLQEVDYRQSTRGQYEATSNKAEEHMDHPSHTNVAKEPSQKQQEQVELDFKQMMQEQQQHHNEEDDDRQQDLEQLAQSFDIRSNQIRNENTLSIDETIADILGSCRQNPANNPMLIVGRSPNIQSQPRHQVQASIDEQQECYSELQSQRPPIKEKVVKPIELQRALEIEYVTQAEEHVSPPRTQEEEEQKASVFPDTYYSVSKKPTINEAGHQIRQQNDGYDGYGNHGKSESVVNITYQDSNKGIIAAGTPSSSFQAEKQAFHYTFENLAHLFQGSAPIPYQPRRGNQVDEQIAQILRRKATKVPVAKIKPGLYLIGCNRCPIDMKLNSVFVKIGGGSTKLEDYLEKHEAAMQATLIAEMVRTNTELDAVMEKIIGGKKLSMGVGLLAERNNSKNTSGIAVSPTRSTASLYSHQSPWRSTSPLRQKYQESDLSSRSNRYKRSPKREKKPTNAAQPWKGSTVIVAPYMEGRGSPQKQFAQLSPSSLMVKRYSLRNPRYMAQSLADATQQVGGPRADTAKGSGQISPFRKPRNRPTAYRGPPAGMI